MSIGPEWKFQGSKYFIEERNKISLEQCEPLNLNILS